MKYFSLLLLCTIFLCPTKAQNQSEEFRCGAADDHNRWLNESVYNAEIYESNMEQIRRYVATHPNKKRDAKYRIPVVFHMVHLGGPENLPHSALEALIDKMNIDMQAENNSADFVRAYMPDLVGVADFEFRIATLDDFGNLTDGVERYYSEHSTSVANYGNNSGEPMKKTRNWNANNYLNIYIVKQINTGEPSGAGVEGYAQFPGRDISTDAIVLEPRLVTSQTGGTTHEFGHFFGLCHTWSCSDDPSQQTNCSADDGIADTPNCIGIPSGAVSCGNQTLNTCTDPTDDRPDNFQNFMDYSYCFANFTPDQIAVMHGTAETVGRRRNLWQPATIAATGTDYDGMPSRPVADFYPSVFNTTICAGSPITYTYDGFDNIDNFAWTFPGGTPATSSEKNPTVTYSEGGVYSATLTVTNSVGSHSFTYENVVEVFGSAPLPPNYSQDFSTIDLSNTTDFTVEDVDNDDKTWVIRTGVGNGDDKSVYLNNRINAIGNIDRLITSTINLSNATEAKLFFDHAFAQKVPNNTDELTIHISENCGVSFSKRATLKGTTLKTADNTTGNFSPADASEWEKYELNLNPYVGKVIQIMLEFKAGGGNNIYLDNFKIDAVLDIDNQLPSISDLTVVPNPMLDGSSTLTFNVPSTQLVTIDVYNMMGKQITAVVNETLQVGEHSFTIEKSSTMSPGMYLIQIKTLAGTQTKKLMVR